MKSVYYGIAVSQPTILHRVNDGVRYLVYSGTEASINSHYDEVVIRRAIADRIAQVLQENC